MIASSLSSMATRERATHMPATAELSAGRIAVAFWRKWGGFGAFFVCRAGETQVGRRTRCLAKGARGRRRFAICKRRGARICLYVMKPRGRVCCPSALRRVHESRPRVTLIGQATRTRRGASVGRLSGSFLPNLARLRPAPPRLLRFYYDSFTRGVTRHRLTRAVTAVAPVLLFTERAASSADANRTKRNFSYAVFVLCVTNGNKLNGINSHEEQNPDQGNQARRKESRQAARPRGQG